ncbi:MAG TPA: metal-sensitive transcriptional regulator [Coriobacteriia bacterium]
MSTQTPGEELAASDEDRERTRIMNRLKRLEGQIRGLQSMIESGQDCEAVMTQVMAAKSALNQAGLHIIGFKLKSCMTSAPDAPRDEVIDEALALLLRFVNLPETWQPVDLAD